MPKATVTSQVKSGLSRAATWILGMAWLGLVFAGIAVAFTPSPHSRILGWILLGLAALIFFALMDRWIRAFPALMAIGTLSSFVCIFSGQMASNPTPVSRRMAVCATLFFATSTALGLTFVGRKLNVLDRIALFAFVVVFFWQAVNNRVAVLPLSVALCALFAAWAHERIRRRGHNHQSAATLPNLSRNSVK